MSNPETRPSRPPQLLDEALGRSALYGILSLALHYPTGQTFEALRSEKTQRVLRQAVAFLEAGRPEPPPEDPAPEERTTDLAAGAEGWLKTFPLVSLDRLLTAHTHLFGHTARGPVCPYETEYGQEGLFQQPRQLAKILGFYRAFGLTTGGAERERADHASCELEFLDFLSRKEAYALECGDQAMLEETRKAIRLFLRDHLGRFGRAFACRLREQDPEGFFGKLGDFLFDFLTFECRRLRIQAGPPRLRLRPAEEDSVPMACGVESELVQLEIPK